MKRLMFFPALVLGIALFFSCASAPPVPEQTGSSVWKITRNGNTIFLGGSIHILRYTDFPLPVEFSRAFAESTTLVLEADITLFEDLAIQQYLLTQMILPDGQTLQTILDSETYELLAAVAAQYGLPLEIFYNLRPSMVMTTLALLQMQRLGFVQEGVDIYFLNKAASANVPVRFLESIESQIDMLLSMGEGYENDFVRYSIQDMENTEVFLADILRDWRTGESASTELSLRTMREEWPYLYRALITDRHDAWMPQIEEYLDSGSAYFVLVGLLHLHGSNGLLQLLEDAGSTIEQFR